MSVKTWMDEFMPDAKRMPHGVLAGLQWCLKKYTGLLKENLKEHGCHITKEWRLADSKGEHPDALFGTKYCPLCAHFSSTDCVSCPITLGDQNKACWRSGSPYGIWVKSGSARAMVLQIRKAIKAYEELTR